MEENWEREEFFSRMREVCGQIPVELADLQLEQFYRYDRLLAEWNKVMNLTAITETEEVIVKHFADSLLLIKALPKLRDCGYSIIDVGTGAGFPGIPLKIAFPNLKITLLDSLNKRIHFLDEVIKELNLTGIRTIHGRAEDFGRDGGYRAQYDVCVSRAVANLSTLSEYCLPFVKVGGCLISYKSGKIAEELEQAGGAMQKLGGEPGPVTPAMLPGTDVERTLVCVKKRAETARKYPRKAGLPSREPLR